MAHDKVSLYKDFYYYELEQKDKLTNKSQFIFALLVSLCTIMTYIIKNADMSTTPSCFLVYLTIVAAILAASSSFFLMKALWSKTYKIISSTKDLDIYIDDALDYNIRVDEYNKEKNQKLNKIDPYDSFIEQLIECTDQNSLNNISRSSNLNLSTLLCILSAIPIAISSIIFTVYDLDLSSPRKEFSVSDKSISEKLSDINKSLSLIKMTDYDIPPHEKSKGANMANDNDLPPIPPTKPKVRVIKEYSGDKIKVNDKKDNKDNKNNKK